MRGVLIVLAATIAISYADKYFNEDVCGLRPFYTGKDDGKVVGGVESKNGDHKWMVALHRNGNFLCGGSIINPYTILTAAHCTQILSLPYYVIRTHTRNPPESWNQRRTVKKIVNHESYNSATFNNDISLLFLDEPFEYNDYVGPVCLATTDPERDPEFDEKSLASGWGSTFSGGSVVNVLRENYMPLTKDRNCTAYYGSSYNPTTMICSAYPGDGADTCQGDSGGPLTVQVKTRFPHAEEIGIVSWGRGCGDIGVYTRVTAYLKWIEDKVKDYYAEIGK